MGEFGWAYVVGTMVQGVSGSVQTADEGRLSGSNVLVWEENEGSGSLRLTGSLNVSGAINANELNINVVNRDVINLTATGSTHFGDSTDDTHRFTGSILLSSSTNPMLIYGLQTGTGESLGHYLALNSNNQVVLTSSVASGGVGLITEYTNAANNRVITSIDSSGINAEANFTFNGSTLSVTGDLSAAVGVSSSTGQYTQLTASELRSTTFTDGTATITAGNISGVGTLTATNVAGTLTTAAQPNVTSLGTLTGLNVAGNVSASALYVNHGTQKVGIGRNDPVRKLEVLTTDPQLRLSYTDFEIFGTSDVFTDIYTNANGYLIMSGTGQRVGIGTTTPVAMLDVSGSMNVSGNLTVTGTLHAQVSEFIVSANNITFGDAATDSLTFNASSGSVPNGLNLDSNTWVLDSTNNRIGIGVDHPETSLHVKNGSAGAVAAINNAVLILESNEKPRIQFQSPNAYGGTIVFGSPSDNDEGQIDYDHGSDRFLFKTGGNTKMTILGSDVGIGTSAPEARLHVVGDTVITEDLAVTGSITGSALTDGTAVMTGGNISSVGTLTATNVNATNIGGTLTTAAQPNVTSLGTLTALNVAGNVSASALYVNHATQKVGIGRNDPVRKLEILTTDPQLRLSYSDFEIFSTADIFTDIYTNSNGYLIMSGTGQRVGIGTTSPREMLDVAGNVNVSGNLTITGSLHAQVSEFIVSANNITFGDAASDTLIFNAASGTIMNGLNLDGNTFVIDSDQDRVGIGVAAPAVKLHVQTTGLDQLRLAYNDAKYSLLTTKANGDLNITPTGNYVSASSGLVVSGSSFLGTDSIHHTVVSGELTASSGLSSSLGQFTTLSGSEITDGTATMQGGNIFGVNTLTATNLGGTLTTAAQANITSLGTLTSLAVSGDLTVDTNTLKVVSSTDKVGIGVVDPQKKLEILDTNSQLRLTYARQVPAPSYAPLKATDIYTNSDGYAILSSSHARLGIQNTSPAAVLDVSGDVIFDAGLKLSGLSTGTGVAGKYLVLDSSNNVVLTSSAGAGSGSTEIRSRRVITSNTTLAVDDYYIGVSASSDLTITLIDASVISDGQTFTIKDEKGNADTYNLQIVGSGSQTIDGAASVRLQSPYGSISIYTDGVDSYFIF